MARFLGGGEYRHGGEEKIGVLLANLGTPEAPTAKALRKYLRQFLSDPRVIETPKWRWLPVLYGIVLPLRAPRSAAAYRKIWTKDGSPLLANCRAQEKKLAAAFAGLPVAVELGMSYGAPSIISALRKLKSQNCRRIAALPLYPQYSGSTGGAVFAAVAKELSAWRAAPHFRYIAAYCDSPRYIQTLADSISAHWKKHGRPDMLIFSFHGTPLDMLKNGDPYHCLCQKTARLAAARLDLPPEKWLVAFQSRFGRAEWLSPATDSVLRELPEGGGVRHVQVVCPAFSSDCLETLEEIAIEEREVFLRAGGEKFSYIPALNDSPAHIDFLESLLRENIGDWLLHLQRENAPENRARQKETAGANGGA
ncbi:MAG: ferrochelatase [Betaproteobacteria bacterium]|nr:ferrochelatase [Betaproteobacteria bacterium]